MAFKMKGWSGSPIKQKPKLDLSTALANIQRNISNTVKGFNIKPQSKSSGFGLNNAQKAQAKKLGISEYQWKTEMGINASTRHKKRTFEKKYGLGKYALPDDKLTKEILDPSDNQALAEYGPDIDLSVPGGKPAVTTLGEESTPTEVDYGAGATTKDWKHKSSTGWSLHELTQERKNFEVGSAEYKKIQEAINAAYKAVPPVEKEEKKTKKKKTISKGSYNKTFQGGGGGSQGYYPLEYPLL